MSSVLGYEILGAVKVKDGLFIGDELAAQDLEFVVANKVTHVINCCARQVPNHWDPIGVVYLTYYWVDDDKQIILDNRDVVANEIFQFIEEALENAESVLIHSVRGQSRSCCVLSAYMMKKYSWGLRKTMEFLSSRRPDLNLKPSFLQQLSGYERRLMTMSKNKFSVDWTDTQFGHIECEELLLRNTYMNSQMGPLAEFPCNEFQQQAAKNRLVWADNSMDDKTKLEKPAGADRLHLSRNQAGQPHLKSICKRKQVKQVEQQISLASRPTTASSENLENMADSQAVNVNAAKTPLDGGYDEPYRKGGVGNYQAAFRDGKPTVTSAWPEPEDGGIQGDTGGYRPDNRDYRLDAERGLVDPGGGCKQAPGGNDLWARSSYPVGGPPPASMSEGQVQPGQQTYLPNSASVPRQGPPSHGGPRDSLVGMRRGESPEPRDNRPRRDASPKSNRPESPMYRGESPLRLLSRSSRGSVENAMGPGKQKQPSASMNLGLCLGAVRNSIPNGNATPSSQTRSNVNGGGMGAFRSGGPVKAKADVFGECGNSLRRNRPATAPSSRGSNSRPASPLGGGNERRVSNSRPGSPQTRTGVQSEQTYARPASPSKPMVIPQYPVIDKAKSRSLSSHMRRAPSPTPAFNRSASPGRPPGPRWRM